jgi:hypothetical protein
MIDAINRAVEEVSKTTPTIMISATTATSGAVGYFHYAVWHDALSLIAMAAGILSCLVLTAVNVLRFIKIMRNEKAVTLEEDEE